MKPLVFLLLPYLSLSEVVSDFKNCNQFSLNKDPPQYTTSGSSPPNEVKHICQCLWDDSDEQKFLYATLYSTTWKIPIYSAYVFGSPNIGRCDVWYIEPQLDIKDGDPCMSPKGYKRIVGEKQAVNKDYDKSAFDRGHLYPVQHTNNHLSMLATSTLTNAAPQDREFNQKAWKVHEKAVIDDLQFCDKAYVVAGVVPDTNKKINQKVVVSKYYWRATCCQKGLQFIGKGYYGPDNNGRVQSLSITDLQKQLIKDYKMINIIIFPSLPIPPGQKRPISDCN